MMIEIVDNAIKFVFSQDNITMHPTKDNRIVVTEILGVDVEWSLLQFDPHHIVSYFSGGLMRDIERNLYSNRTPIAPYELLRITKSNRSYNDVKMSCVQRILINLLNIHVKSVSRMSFNTVAIEFPNGAKIYPPCNIPENNLIHQLVEVQPYIDSFMVNLKMEIKSKLLGY